MDNGFFTVHRKIFDHPLWKKPLLAHLAIHLIGKANHETKRFIFNGHEQEVKRGQLLTGRFSLAQETGQNPSTIRNSLKILENIGFLDIKSTNRFSLITLVKYSQYQDKDKKKDSDLDNQRTTRGQPEDTNNNVNNKNNKYLVAKATVDLGKFPRADYSVITESYKKIKGVEPKGKEWLPILKEIKLMFQSGRTPPQIVKAMEVCNSLYDDWAMSTIRMKIADVVSGKLINKTKPGESSLEIKSVKQR